VIILKHIMLMSVLVFDNWILIERYEAELKNSCTVQLQSEPSTSTNAD